MKETIKIINECADALNAMRHEEAAKLLTQIDVRLGNNNVPVEMLFHRTKLKVFYRCQDPGLLMPMGGMSRLRAVGLQPFSRPGEQAGLVYEMREGENFNDIVISKELFSHDKVASEFIFNYTNRSKKLFPHSPLESNAQDIKSSKVFSTLAYADAIKEFYADTPDEVLKSYLADQGVTISDKIDFSFTEAEKEQCIKDWKEGEEERLLSKIIVRPVFNGGDIPIFGGETRFTN